MSSGSGFANHVIVTVSSFTNGAGSMWVKGITAISDHMFLASQRSGQKDRCACGMQGTWCTMARERMCWTSLSPSASDVLSARALQISCRRSPRARLAGQSACVPSVPFNSVLSTIKIYRLTRNEATTFCDTCRTAPSPCLLNVAMDVPADWEGLCGAAAVLVGRQQAVQVHQRG